MEGFTLPHQKAHGSHTVYRLQYHLVWVQKYRCCALHLKKEEAASRAVNQREISTATEVFSAFWEMPHPDQNHLW